MILLLRCVVWCRRVCLEALDRVDSARRERRLRRSEEWVRAAFFETWPDQLHAWNQARR